MDNQMILKEGTPSILEKVFAEEPAISPENRWQKVFDPIFTSLVKTATRFFASRVKSGEVVQTQSHIQQFFRKTDYLEKIRSDKNLQDVFLLGYCHGYDMMMESFENETSHQWNESLKSVISSYKYMEPTIRILDQTSEISHKELAERLNISESALSNFMKKVERYHIFNSIRTGKNKYYSLARPNGVAALKIVKESSDFTIDSYTEFLLLLMDSLRSVCMYDELGKEYVMEHCGEMLSNFTTRSNLCRMKLNDLVLMLKSERVFNISLTFFEKTVKKRVTIFTKDPKSEIGFLETILENIMNKDITYQWFFIGTEKYNSADKVMKAFSHVFSSSQDSVKFDNLKDKVQCYYIPEKKTESLSEDNSFEKKLFEKCYDAVIYDKKQGFICEDETISNATPYIGMTQDQLYEFCKYINADNELLDEIAID